MRGAVPAAPRFSIKKHRYVNGSFVHLFQTWYFNIDPNPTTKKEYTLDKTQQLNQADPRQVYVCENDESILVVKRDKLFPTDPPSGLKPIDFAQYEKLILENAEFRSRAQVEVDTSFKQIIPYLIFKFDNKYFLMQRTDSGSETRLRNKYSLGIGGHIVEEDLKGRSIYEWALREFNEEVAYKGKLKIKPIGLINDESNFVGKVHTGFLFLLEGDSANIKARKEFRSGHLATIDEISAYYSEMESWSKMALDFLRINDGK